VLFYGAALVACPAVADETTILFNVTIAYILYFYVCLMYNKANNKANVLNTNFFLLHKKFQILVRPHISTILYLSSPLAAPVRILHNVPRPVSCIMHECIMHECVAAP